MLVQHRLTLRKNPQKYFCNDITKFWNIFPLLFEILINSNDKHRNNFFEFELKLIGNNT